MKLLEYGFSAVFISFLIVCGMGVAFVFVHFIVTPLIRIVWPKWAVLQRPETKTVVDDRVAHRKIALDFVIEERQRRARQANKNLHALLNAPVEIPVTANFLPANKTMYATEHNISRPPAKDVKGNRLPNPDELYALAKFPHGEDRTPHYLCAKKSTREGLKTAYAPLIDRAIKMDWASASRWLNVLGEEVMIVPANAAARESQRKKLSEMAARLREDRRFYEKSNAAAV